MGKEEKKDLESVYSDLKKLSRDDLMKTYGFALGLSAKSGSESRKRTDVSDVKS